MGMGIVAVNGLSAKDPRVTGFAVQCFSDSGLTDIVAEGAALASYDVSAGLAKMVGAVLFDNLLTGNTYYLRAAPIQSGVTLGTWSSTVSVVAGADPRLIDLVVDPLVSEGDIIVSAAFGVPERLPVGSDGQVLTARSTATYGVDWETPSGGGMTNPMTTAGDLITGGSSGTPGRLGIGSSGQVLTVVSGAPAWTAPSGGSYPSPSTQTGNNTTGVFTFPLSSSYNDYEIRFSGLAVAVNATSLKIQFSTNGGSSYDSSTSDYPNAYHYLSVIGGLGENSANDQTGDNTFLGSLSNASTAGISGTLRIYATQSSQYKLCEWRMVNPRGDGNTIHIYGSTIYQTTSAITDIQISAGSGNFTGGSVTVQPLPQ